MKIVLPSLWPGRGLGSYAGAPRAYPDVYVRFFGRGRTRVVPEWGELQIDQLRFMAQRYGDEVAYRNLDAGTALTFGEWDGDANRLARGLVEAGVRPGERVSIFLPGEEVLRWITAYAAVHKAGAVVVPTNTRLSVPELRTILGHAEVATILTCESLLGTVLEVSTQLPDVERVVSAGGDGARVLPWDDVLHPDASDMSVPVGLDDLADVMYTSGTTGLPKGIAVRHSNVAMIPNNEPVWTANGWLHGAPMFTFAGIAFIYNPMKMGLVGLYQAKFDAGRWLDYVERERPTMCMLVPAFAELIVAHPEFEARDLSSLQTVSVGSAPIAPATLRTLIERLPDATVSNSYGMTEAGPAYIVMPKEEALARIGSVGKPIGPMEIKVVDDDGTEQPAGEVGELLMRMEGKRREYYKDDDATSSTWTDDGWLRTGDLAYVDADGYLYLVGRKKDMIIRGGNNIYATDVEAVLLEHPDVREAAVAGIPHTVLGEDVGAWVVVQPDSDLTVETLQSFCAERLADYKRPRRVELVGELPRNATGKVMKHLLSGGQPPR
jgi:acyl-CoA synthetase (AMP-forming)/AMP-acid ligase II